MELKEKYLKYDDYMDLGGTLDEAPFKLLEYEASRKIDFWSFNRLVEADYEDIPEEVKMCDFKLINSLESYAKTSEGISNNSGVQSESIDGYSVSYLTLSQVKDIVTSKNAEMDDIVRQYLINTEFNGEMLLYRGV